MKTLIDTTFTDVDIETAASVYEYTALADGSLRIQVGLTDSLGDGEYIVYLTLNDGGAMSDAPILGKTTALVPAGETAFWFASMDVDVMEDDVVNVFVEGLTGDTAEEGHIRIFDSAKVALIDGAITAATIATDAIDADAISDDAVTEIQDGLATPTNITAGVITTVTDVTNDVGITQAGADKVWDTAVRTLTSSGGATAADVWAYATRSLTKGVIVIMNNDKYGYTLADNSIGKETVKSELIDELKTEVDISGLEEQLATAKSRLDIITKVTTGLQDQITDLEKQLSDAIENVAIKTKESISKLNNLSEQQLRAALSDIPKTDISPLATAEALARTQDSIGDVQSRLPASLVDGKMDVPIYEYKQEHADMVWQSKERTLTSLDFILNLPKMVFEYFEKNRKEKEKREKEIEKVKEDDVKKIENLPDWYNETMGRKK